MVLMFLIYIYQVLTIKTSVWWGWPGIEWFLTQINPPETSHLASAHNLQTAKKDYETAKRQKHIRIHRSDGIRLCTVALPQRSMHFSNTQHIH